MLPYLSIQGMKGIQEPESQQQWMLYCPRVFCVSFDLPAGSSCFSPSGCSHPVVRAHCFEWVAWHLLPILGLLAAAIFLRFTTDANLGGVEKLSITSTRPSLGLEPAFDILATEVDDAYSGLLQPQQFVYVKGWSRSIAALCVMLCHREDKDFAEAGSADVVPMLSVFMFNLCHFETLLNSVVVCALARPGARASERISDEFGCSFSVQ